MRPLLALVAAGLLAYADARADSLQQAPYTDAQAQAASKAVSAVLPGTFTVATLPSPATAGAGKYAFVTDLGGGPDMVLSDGTNWKHIRQGNLGTVAAASAVTLTPLLTPPIVQITGNNITTAVNLSIAQANLYPGEVFHILTPSGVLGTLGTMGISVFSISGVVPLLSGQWADVMWNGTTLVKIAGGTL